jgi:hypothetical protein
VGGIAFVIARIWIISSPIKVYQIAYLLFEGIIAEIARHVLFWVGGVVGVIFFSITSCLCIKKILDKSQGLLLTTLE